ncbi:DUF1289 domain-containing protein [Cupriavidus basilensis]|uniref:DUF1289 domain-containing protein n=1 Tax=Cupriavidus sp. SK-3 TaxID=1470558 RepID=UPI00056A4157|nr:DUF1289 domain-containing protein [Cupriavidus sp. SK-3]
MSDAGCVGGAQPIADPCVNICRMDSAARYCQGCRRTLAEIGLWHQMTEAQKASVIEATRDRGR